MNMVKSMRKAVVLRSVFAFFGLSMTAANADAADAGTSWSMDIVDELDALSQQGEQTNPWAASQGGTWGFYEGTAADLGEAWTYTKTDKGLVGFFDASRLYCCFLANPSTSQKTGPSAINANIAGRKVLYHPKSASSVETLRCVTESAGIYSISGTVKKLSTSGNGITASVVINGTAYLSVTSDATAVTFAVTNQAVWAGETIDLKLTANGNVANDATELTCVLTRVGDIALPIVQTASEALNAATATEMVENPVVGFGGRPGTWGFYKRGTDDAALAVRRTEELTTRTVDGWKTLTVNGLAATDAKDAYPRFLANSTHYPLQPQDSKKDVEPGEMFFAPANSGFAVIRYTAEFAGNYSFAVSGRDVGSGSGNGVNFEVVQVLSNGGGTAALSHELLAPAGEVELEGSGIWLRQGDSIELVLDGNGNYAYDATAVKFSVSLDEKSEACGSYSPLQAMRDDCASAMPTSAGCVDAYGASWSFGYVSETDFAFMPFASEMSENGVFRGWKTANFLELRVNKDNASANCSGIGIVSGLEFAVHPDSGKAATVRFQAPADGLYSVRGYIRPLNAAGGNGVEGRVLVRESGFATSAYAAAKANLGLPSRADLTASGLWLKANDSVDLSLGPNGDFGYDASAMSWIVSRTGDLPTLPYVSFDICGTVRDSVSGAGRIGLATDGAWVPVRAGSMKSSLGPVVGGMRRAVQLVLSKPASSAALANVATVVSDGVVSAGADDPVAFSVTGLEPNQTYSFCAYSRNASGVCGVFEIGGEARTADETWFCHVGGDCCRFMATADANGVIMGTFRGTSDGAATFCALQVTGETFPEFKPNGGILIFR